MLKYMYIQGKKSILAFTVHYGKRILWVLWSGSGLFSINNCVIFLFSPTNTSAGSSLMHYIVFLYRFFRFAAAVPVDLCPLLRPAGVLSSFASLSTNRPYGQGDLTKRPVRCLLSRRPCFMVMDAAFFYLWDGFIFGWTFWAARESGGLVNMPTWKWYEWVGEKYLYSVLEIFKTRYFMIFYGY